MSQVSELDPVTVFGDALHQRSATRHAKQASGAVTSPVSRAPRRIAWWRVALGILVIAIWIAAAVSASGTSIARSGSALKSGDSSLRVQLQCAMRNERLADANPHFYLNDEITGAG